MIFLATLVYANIGAATTAIIVAITVKETPRPQTGWGFFTMATTAAFYGLVWPIAWLVIALRELGLDE